MTKKSNRHSWGGKGHWTSCKKCGCRYQRGMLVRTYEQPDGSRTTEAGECRGYK